MAKVVFMGTPEFAVPVLEALIQQHHVIGVVTQPDRPAGRKRKLQESPIKKVALQHDIPVFQPEKLGKRAAIDELAQWQSDVQIVAAYGQILKQEVLDLPVHGSINVHASLLPRWRGASPIHRAIQAGDKESGVSIMQMDAGMDTGPVYAKLAISLEPKETAQTLHDKLAQLSPELLIEVLPHILSGDLEAQPQDEALVTLAPMIKKEEGLLDWSKPAEIIERWIRAFTPWPSTYTFWNDEQLKIHSADYGSYSTEPGEVIRINDRIAIGTGDGVIYPRMLQLEGKQQTPIEDFIRGYPDFVGSSLESS